MTTSSRDWTAIKNFLNSHSSFLICGHENIDGDSYGSLMGMYFIIHALGKKVMIYNRGKLASYLKGSFGTDYFLKKPPLPPLDSLFVVDCLPGDRCGLNEKAISQYSSFATIDHHPGTMPEGTIGIIDASSSSASEMVTELMQSLQLRPDPQTATALYVGLCFDTGFFTQTNTSPGALRAAAFLLNSSPDALLHSLETLRKKNLKGLRLAGEVFSKLELSPCKRWAWFIIDQSIIRKFNATMDDTEGIIESVRDLEGIEGAYLVKETEPGKWKVNLRSTSAIDVCAAAKLLGGGGHKQASGLNFSDKSPQEVIDIINTEIKRQLDNE